MKSVYNKKHLAYLSSYLQGLADGFSERERMHCNLLQSAEALEMLSRKVCAQGFICTGGDTCSSDHK